jgi:hypothetical protein
MVGGVRVRLQLENIRDRFPNETGVLKRSLESRKDTVITAVVERSLLNGMKCTIPPEPAIDLFDQALETRQAGALRDARAAKEYEAPFFRRANELDRNVRAIGDPTHSTIVDQARIAPPTFALARRFR